METCNGPFIEPSHLLVKYGDPASAKCSTNPAAMMGWESPVGGKHEFSAELIWKVESLTDWTLGEGIQCYALYLEQCLGNLSITIYKPPARVSIRVVSNLPEIVAGDTIQLECLIEDVAPKSHLKVTWFRGQDQLTLPTIATVEGKENENVTVTEKLELTAGTEHHRAQYRCEAKLEINGLEPPPVKSSESLGISVSFAPVIYCSSKVQVRENETLPNCTAEGHPSPEVMWSKGDQQVDPLSPLSRENGGQYTLTARNRLGIVNQTVDVEILFCPEIICSMKARLKENERLPKCTAIGNPAPQVTWFKGHQQVDTLLLLSRTDKGQYIVYARNSVGGVNQTVDIDILYGPEINCPQKLELTENEVLMGCTVKGNPPPEVTWYKGDPKSKAFRKFDPTSKLGKMDGGNYTVFAESNISSVQQTVEVVIVSKGNSISMSGVCVLLLLLVTLFLH